MYKGTPSDANTSNPRENGWVQKVRVPSGPAAYLDSEVYFGLP